MKDEDILSDHSLKMIEERLCDTDWEIIAALSEVSVMNKSQINVATQLSISEVRDSVSRLFGGCIIYMRRLGNSTQVKLTPSGQRLMKLQKQYYKERRSKNEK